MIKLPKLICQLCDADITIHKSSIYMYNAEGEYCKASQKYCFIKCKCKECEFEKGFIMKNTENHIDLLRKHI